MESSHLDLTSVLDGNKCQHCWDELSGVGFAAFISHVAKGCHYYRIIFMAIDWAVPSLLTFSQIREIRIFHLGSIEIFHGEHEGCETLTVFQTVRKLLFIHPSTAAYLSRGPLFGRAKL
jgi:hypothetical protein